ncbi:MAG: A24 family peptidase [Candidatus Wallbacteria bacterium]|nr:A24 family peptidase [Candidatus Wallbacteria bacterium]
MSFANQMSMTVYLLILIACIYTDIRKRLIYNWVTFPGMVAGLLFSAVAGGQEALLGSITGIGLGFGLLLIPFLLRGVGAGDVKLLMVCGSFTGVSGVVFIFLVGSVLGFFGSIAMILRSGGQAGLSLTMATIASGEFLRKKLPQIQKKDTIPYGVFYGLAGMIFPIRGVL